MPTHTVSFNPFMEAPVSRFSRHLGLIALFLVLAGCNHTQPIYNVEQEAVPVSARQKVSTEQVGAIIVKVASNEGWIVEKTKPGLLHCKLNWREHTAVVDIVYSDKDYSIHHVSSENLKDQDGKIHRKYNERIHQLQDEIDRALSIILNG